MNVAAYLPLLAKAQPDVLSVAVASPGPGGTTRYQSMTASQLDQRSDRIAHALVSVGIERGTRTVLMVKPSLDFFALTFAMLKVGAVPVMVDPGMGIKNLGTCLAEAEPAAFIGIPKAHIARFVLGWAKATLRTKIMVGPWVPGGGPTLAKLEAAAPDTPYAPIEPETEETAAILFTSGSTGVPKGVITPHRVFAAQVQAIKDVFGIEPGERDLATFPLFALFGPALGMASIVPDMDASRPAEADPKKLVDTFRQYECTNMFASPALIDKLGRYCESEKIELTGLRRAISAGAPASIPAVERFVKALPAGAQVFTPYGATESLPVAVIGSDDILAKTREGTENGGGVCVGKPVAGMEVVIIKIDDEPIAQWSDVVTLPVGEIGEIVVKGAVVTPAYYNREDSTRLAKIADGDAVRHRMGDVGYLDEEGQLWMCGRKAHRVQTESGPMFTVCCEAVFNRHDAVRRTALVGTRDGEVIRPVLCVELEPGRDGEWPAVEAQLVATAKEHGHTKAIVTFLLHPGSFPVDVRHNSKIFREKLAVWAQERV
ncbi:MAG: AMP-binding protein [Nannocystaceae bacterium]|nr:AMP-binding protein [Nannocystaceae bacterium]